METSNADTDDESKFVDDDEPASPVLGLFVVGTFVLFMSFVFFFFFVRPLVFG